MKLSRYNYLKGALLNLFMVLAISSTTIACNDNSGEVGVGDALVELKDSVANSNGGTCQIALYANIGTQWSARIISGEEYASFDINSSVGEISGVVESQYSNRLYIYFSKNNLSSPRKAQIEFTYQGQPSEIINLQQTSLEIDNSDPVYSWTELPEQQKGEDYLYVTHFTELNGVKIRNFSLCYDKEARAARWVAYPFHKVYDSANVGRVEEWRYDPKIPTKYQPDLTHSYSGSYDRGHQCPSADRQSTEEMNSQTYYYSNMTPQLDKLNRVVWASMEAKVRDQVCSDTLYVVTGADYDHTMGSCKDDSNNSCAVPGAYFKVLLRTRTGVTGKAVEDCDASELKAIGFWFEHKSIVAIPEPVSVETIEERTGFRFFPTIPQEVKESYNKSLWSL